MINFPGWRTCWQPRSQGSQGKDPGNEVGILDLIKTFAKKLDLIRWSGFLPKDVLLNFYFKVIFPSVTYNSFCGGRASMPIFFIHWNDCTVERQGSFSTYQKT